MKKYIYQLPLLLLAVFLAAACSSDEPDYNQSIITIGNTERTEFDDWLEASYVNPYNIAFKYRYEDIETDLNYYVVPAEYKQAIKMAHLVKFLCIETYNEVAGTDFTCEYFPKMFFTIGEFEYLNNGTMILGTAEGGRKILLAGLNYLDRFIQDAEMLNTLYFKTIHHEFTHILNQTKPIPPEFQMVTGNGYVGDSWSEEPFNAIFLTRGFISDYAQHSYQEDFAEMMSVYITNAPASWQVLLNDAGEEAALLIQRKLDIVKEYMLSSFNIDLDVLRNALQRRQNEVISGKVDLEDLTVK